MPLILVLGLSALLGTCAANLCLDPTSTYYSCELDDSGRLALFQCSITDGDVDDLATCLDDVGRENITWLSLTYNDLTTLPEEIFDGLSALTELYLYDNVLSTLPEGVFESLTSLVLLRLDGNPLECLPIVPSTLVEVDDDASAFADGLHVDPYGDECGCSVLGVTDNVCGEETCTPGEFGYTCAAAMLAPVPAPTEAPTSTTLAPATPPTPAEAPASATLAPSPAPTEAPSSATLAPATPPTPAEAPASATLAPSPTPAEAPASATLAPATPPTEAPVLAMPASQSAPKLTPAPNSSSEEGTLPPVPVPTSTPSTGTTAPARTLSTSRGDATDSTPVIAGVSSAVAVVGALIGLGLWLWQRPKKQNIRETSDDQGVVSTSDATAPAPAPSVTAAVAGLVQAIPSHPEQPRFSGKNSGARLGGGDAKDLAAEQSLTATISTANMSTAGRAELEQFYEHVANAAPVVDESTPGDVADDTELIPSGRRRPSGGGIGLGQVVMEAAENLAYHSQIPGVSEAASVVSTLVKLVSDSRNIKSGGDSNLRQCRSIVGMLERASKVAGRGGETTTAEQRGLIEEVHYAVEDLVELIRTYQSKKKLSKVLMSTSFKRRQNDLEAAIDRALGRLQFGLQVQVGDDVSAVKEGMDVFQGSIALAKSESRRARRQRKMDQAEIPEDQVWISDELLGKGGFGEVFLAEYNTRNAAAKVMHITHDLGKLGESEVLEGRSGGQPNPESEKSQRKAFLRELDAMIRLRSPHTVFVYGAITSRPDRLILVMELLAGGDLRTLLKNSEQPLPEEQSRRIIRDICTGMHFLHGKETVHGDLKSANVLLDGAGRAKIGDFGTSRWSHHTNSTGLVTHTKGGQNTQMSLAWSAPEVLGASGSTFASDVYSFGIVAWEILSRELPWESVAHPREVYIRVVLNELRPDIPVDAPADIANMLKACWAGEPDARPTFSAIMERIESNGWTE